MKSSLRAYWLSLTFIARDVSLLYKNFFHWNASKLAIWIYAFLFGTVLSLPAIGLIVWAGYAVLKDVPEASLSLFTSSGTLDEQLLGALTGHSWILIGVVTLFLIIIAIYAFTLTYAYFLEAKLYDSYLAGEKLPILGNLYFSKYHLKKFLGVLSWSSLYILPPIGVGILVLFVLFLLTHFGVLDQANGTHSAIIGGIALISLIGCVTWMIVLAVRLVFSYMLLLDQPNLHKTARSFVTDSFALTKGRIRQIIALFFPFLIVVSIAGGIIGSINNRILTDRAESIINAIAKSNPQDFVDDHSYVKRHFLNAFALNENDIANIIAINNHFNPKTDGIDRDYLEAVFPYLDLGVVDPNSWKIESAFAVVEFLLIEGVMVMVYFSVFTLLRNTGKPAKSSPAPREESAEEKPKKTPAKKPSIKKPASKKESAEEKAPKKKTPAKKTTAKKPATKSKASKA